MGDALHVVHIISDDLWAGAEVQAYTLILALHAVPQVNVSVIALNEGEIYSRLVKKGVSITVFSERQFGSVKMLGCLTKYLKSVKPDVIHTHRFKENILGSVAGALAGFVPSIRTVHGAMEHNILEMSPGKALVRAVDVLIGRYVQKAVVAVSDDLARILRPSYSKEKIYTVENGIDTSQSVSRHSDLFSSGRQDNEKIRVGFAGRLVPVKRVDLFIAAARYVHENCSRQVEFHVYGDGPLFTEAERQINNAGASGYIHLFGQCSDMMHELSCLDVLLLTSDHEGLPMILLESMLAKTPVIASSVGGIPVLLNHGECGVMVDGREGKNFGDEIIRLIGDKERYVNIQKNAYERVCTRYSATENVRRYVHLYNAVAKS